MRSIHGFPLVQIYAEAYLERLGFSYEQFAAAPIATLYAAGQPDAIDIMRSGYRPLLPKQVALRRALQAKWKEEGHPAEPQRRSRSVVHRPVGLVGPGQGDAG